MHGLWSTPIDAIKFDDVREFCARKVPENLRLEYKSKFSSKDPGKQIAKEVAAFANIQGGIILYGVNEVENRLPDPSPYGLELGSGARQRVISACTDNFFPPITPEVSDFIPNPDDPSKGFLVIRVAASKEIHTTDDGAGIYIRVADQSEPQRATLDMIDHLLTSRRAQIDLQAQRRANAMDRLATAMNCTRTGEFWFMAGPMINIEPLFTLEQLRDQAAGWSVHSHYFSYHRTPIDSSRALRGALDSVYESEVQGEGAGALDIYGNVTIFAHLVDTLRVDPHAVRHDEDLARLAAPDGSIEAVRADVLTERILAGFRCARNVCRAAGFVGLLAGRVYVTGIDRMRLTVPDRHMSYFHVIGACLGDSEIDITFERATSDLTEDHSIGDSMESVVHRLLWAWGCTAADTRPYVLERGESLHFGQDRCSKDNQTKPRNRPCPKCGAGPAQIPG